MHNGVMANANVVANRGGCFLVGTVDACAILHVYFIAQTDAVYITTDNGIKPYTALSAHHHIAYNSGIFSNETIFRNLRALALYW